MTKDPDQEVWNYLDEKPGKVGDVDYLFGSLIKAEGMKVKIVVSGMEAIDGTQSFSRTMSEVWSGEMEVKEGVFVTKISIIAEGELHPICDIPFSLTEGYWTWHSAEADWPNTVEKLGGVGFDESGKPVQT